MYENDVIRNAHTNFNSTFAKLFCVTLTFLLQFNISVYSLFLSVRLLSTAIFTVHVSAIVVRIGRFQHFTGKTKKKSETKTETRKKYKLKENNETCCSQKEKSIDDDNKRFISH